MFLWRSRTSKTRDMQDWLDIAFLTTFHCERSKLQRIFLTSRVDLSRSRVPRLCFLRNDFGVDFLCSSLIPRYHSQIPRIDFVFEVVINFMIELIVLHLGESALYSARSIQFRLVFQKVYCIQGGYGIAVSLFFTMSYKFADDQLISGVL